MAFQCLGASGPWRGSLARDQGRAADWKLPLAESWQCQAVGCARGQLEGFCVQAAFSFPCPSSVVHTCLQTGIHPSQPVPEPLVAATCLLLFEGPPSALQSLLLSLVRLLAQSGLHRGSFTSTNSLKTRVRVVRTVIFGITNPAWVLSSFQLVVRVSLVLCAPPSRGGRRPSLTQEKQRGLSRQVPRGRVGGGGRKHSRDKSMPLAI